MAQRDKNLPRDNMWDCYAFQSYLKRLNCFEKWSDVILPGIQQSIVCAMLASQETMDRRPNTFELYGADFMLSEDFKPWLIEINCSPDLSPSTSVTSKMCPEVLRDIIKVVIDKKKDPNADTGLFQLIYKQNMHQLPAYLGLNLAVRGRKIFRHRNKLQAKTFGVDKENDSRMFSNIKRQLLKCNVMPDQDSFGKFRKLSLQSATIYNGPVIEDFIKDLNKSFIDDKHTSNDKNSEKTRKTQKKNKNGINGQIRRPKLKKPSKEKRRQ